MSYFWEKLPYRFLKMRYPAFSRLPLDVQTLVGELAEKQKYTCAICTDATSNLEIEHEHDPGGRVKYSVKNVRGLVCRRCNFQVSLYERHEQGTYSGLDHVYPWLSDHTYQAYAYDFECRVADLEDRLLRARIGEYQYWKRRPFMDKFDDWREYGDRYPWPSYFREIKMRRSPKYALNQIFACVRFYAAELKRNPAWEPPDQVVVFLFKLKEFFEAIEAGLPVELKARVIARREARLEAPRPS